MLVNLSAPVSDASGALGSSVVFYRWRTSQCLRDYVVPTNPATSNQVIVRAALASITKLWKGLTQQNRDSWESYAAANLITDRLGRQVKSTALGWYLACNSMLQYAGQSLISDAPTYAPPQPATGFSLVKNDAGSGTIVTSVTFSGAAPVGALWLGRVETLESAACKPVLRRQGTIAGPIADSFSAITTSGSNVEFVTVAPGAVGAWVGFTLQMVDIRTGLVSLPYTKAIQVVSA